MEQVDLARPCLAEVLFPRGICAWHAIVETRSVVEYVKYAARTRAQSHHGPLFVQWIRDGRKGADAQDKT